MNNKGITLIALVITIIIMLILAGVSVTLVLNEDNGLVTKTQSAVNTYSNHVDAEQTMLNSVETTFQNYIDALNH